LARIEALESRKLLSAGELFPDFGSGGIVNRTYRSTSDGVDVLVQPDGKLLVVGNTDGGGAKDLLLARFMPNGQPDPLFGDNGVAIVDVLGNNLDDIGTGIALLPDNRIFVSGVTGNTSLGQGDFFGAMFSHSGTLDGSFGQGGMKVIDLGGLDASTANLFDPAFQRLILSGTSLQQTSGGIGLVALNLDGSFASDFGNSGIVVTQPPLGQVEGGLDIARASDGLVVSGFSGNAGIFEGPSVSQLVAKFSAETGALDPTFGTAGRSTLNFGNPINLGAGVAVDPTTGKIVVTGTTADGNLEVSPGTVTGPLGAGAQNGEFTVARLNADGSPDNSFSNDGKATAGFGTNIDGASGVVLQRDGKIVVSGGSQDKTNGDSSFLTARFRPDGTLDPTFGNGGLSFTDLGASDGAFDIAMSPDGKIYVTGHSKGAGSGKLTILQIDNDGLKVLPGIIIGFKAANPSLGEDLRFNVSLTEFSDQPITVRAFTQDDSAKAGEDYIFAEQTLTFAPGETLKIFEVLVLPNRDNFVNEKLFARLADPTNAALLVPVANGLIVNELGFSGDLEVSDLLTTKVPANLIGGTRTAKAVLNFVLRNTRTALVKGTTTAIVYGSPDGTLNSASNPVLGRVTLKPNLKPGRTLKSKVNLVFPRVNSDQQTTLFLVLEGTGVASGRKLIEPAATPLTVQAARATLNGPASPLNPFTVGHFKKYTVTVPVTNTGNVDAAGEAEFEVKLVGNGRTFTYFTKKVKLKVKPGKAANVKIALTAPPATPTGNFGALPAGVYELRVKLLVSRLAGVTNPTDGQDIATASFTLG
jgi:uncharacterized delta-60 repeat protein